MRKRLFRSTLLAIAASLGIGIASLTGLTALATENEDNTSNDAETGSFTETNSDVSTRSLAPQPIDESGSSSSRTGMGYVWTHDVYGSISHWLGAFDVGNGLEWCIDFSTGAPTGAGTLATDLTPSYYGPSSYKDRLSVTNAQMGWILYTYQDTNTAISRAAIAVIVHANYEAGAGQEYIPILIDQLASDSDGQAILETAAQYVDEAKEAGVVGVYSSAGTNENTRAQVTDVGVKNGKGEWVAGRDFTLTISGDAVWDSVSGYTISTDGKTLSGTTKDSALSFWLTATDTGTVKIDFESDLTVTYEITKRGRTSTQSTILQEGYTDSYTVTVLAATFDLIYDFQPLATSKTENIQKGQEIVDTLEVSADETYHNGAWPQVDGENIAVTFEGTAYYLGTTHTDEALDEVPEDAQVVATATIKANGPGTYKVSTNTTSETSGYVTWVWEINKTANTRAYTVGSTTYTAGDFIHSDWSDSYNLEDETLYYIMQFQPILTSSVANCKINDPVEDGQTQTLCDTLEVTTDNVSEGLNGERAGTAWPQVDGENIAVTFEGTAYYTGEHPAEETNEVPEDAIVAARTAITVTEPGSYDIEADLIGDYDPSFITWVWEVRKETNQQHTYTVLGEEISSADFIVDNWADSYGLEDETLVNRWQTNVVSSISSRESADGTYLVDDLWVTGLPSDHGEWEGTCTTSATTSSTCFEADVATFTQSLYFFPKDVEVSEENKEQATLIGSEEVSATNGFHSTISSTQWLWPQDEDGNNLEGTVVFQTSFEGDDRVAPYMSDITDKTEQISNFTSDSLATTEDTSQYAGADAAAQDNDSLALTGAAIAGGLAAAAALTATGSYLIYRNRKTNAAVEEITE